MLWKSTATNDDDDDDNTLPLGFPNYAPRVYLLVVAIFLAMHFISNEFVKNISLNNLSATFSQNVLYGLTNSVRCFSKTKRFRFILKHVKVIKKKIKTHT